MTSAPPFAATPYAEVIGDPVEHSKSPIIHAFWLERLGIAADYRRTRVAPDQLATYLAERQADPAWRGCNVTMPLKLEALIEAEVQQDEAVQAGACNTLVAGPTGLTASNTDIGAVMLVVERLAAVAAGTDVTLLGSGGAARAVLVALKRLGLDRIVVQARNGLEAATLADRFDLKLSPHPFDAPIRTRGLINATPLGMTGAAPLDLDLTAMPAGGWVFDLVTSPDPTALVGAALQRGFAAVGGLAMLIEQAAAAFPLFFGADPPRSADDDAELLRRLQP